MFLLNFLNDFESFVPELLVPIINNLLLMEDIKIKLNRLIEIGEKEKGKLLKDYIRIPVSSAAGERRSICDMRCSIFVRNCVKLPPFSGELNKLSNYESIEENEYQGGSKPDENLVTPEVNVPQFRRSNLGIFSYSKNHVRSILLFADGSHSSKGNAYLYSREKE